MVAVIHFGKNLRAILSYNEQKVSEQVATCIDAVNYPLEAGDLNYNQKLNRLQKLADLNLRSKEKAIHVSLNFDPSEKLSDDILREITAQYMDKIGFGGQPYLLYQHFDSGHPHVHLVTTNIKPDGKRIGLHNLGKIQSEQARKEIEISFGLVRAEQHKDKLFKLKPIDVAKVQYGKTQTRRAIYNVLYAVLKSYKYTSLTELNAVLKLYNVTAERGSEDSRTHKHQGLLYRVLDGDGIPVGVPIKASLFPEMFPQKPTLKFLESRYMINDTLRQSNKHRIKSAIDFALVHAHRTTIDDMVNELARNNIDTIIHQNQQGRIYGITFIDHKEKCVWNGSDLGKQYSANGILQRFKPDENNQKMPPEKIPMQVPIYTDVSQQPHPKSSGQPIIIPKNPGIDSNGNSILEDLMRAEYTSENIPYQWKKRRRKKRNQSKNL